ncbi:MAG: hypothetical protein JWN04_427 [Myxococcaceae bacterium]|nr:hypothetical protein [Myxococcaceae bacterium]
MNLTEARRMHARSCLQSRARARAAIALGLALLACSFVSTLSLAEDATRKPFSEDEKKRLVAGQLVTRPVSERRGDLRLIGGSSWQVIKAPPEVVLRALLDTKSYDKLLPTVTGASLVTEAPTMRRVRVEHKRGPLGIAYRLALTIDAQRHDINFKLNDRLDSGMRAAWGYLTATPYGQNQTLLSYGVMADPGDGLIVGIVRGVIHEWMLKVPAQVRRHVESKQGRALYGSGLLRSCGSGSGSRNLDGGQAQQCAP